MLAKRLELTREDRVQLAEVLLWKDVASWKDLSDEDVQRLLDAFEGYALISHLRTQQEPPRRTAEPSGRSPASTT